MQQAEPLGQISHGSLLTALFLIHGQVLATCIPCICKHLPSNDLENHFLPHLQAIPQDPHLPERNQLVSGIFGWTIMGGLYLPAGNCCSHATTSAADIHSTHSVSITPLRRKPCLTLLIACTCAH